MITKLSVTTIYVLDKDEALDFYVNKLGLEVGQDFKQGSLPLADGARPRRPRHRDLPGAARAADPRRSHRRAAPRADHEGRDERPRLRDGRRPRLCTRPSRRAASPTSPRSRPITTTAPTWASATRSATASGSSSRQGPPEGDGLTASRDDLRST